MNPIVFALRHPVTVVVGVLALAVGGALAFYRMKIDIFPSLNLPVVYVAQPYGGMDPGQMEGLITNYYEYHFLYIGGIHHVESKNVQGVALMKLYFHPGTDMAQAMAETVGYVNRSRAFMPPGTVPPFIMRFDTGSVPVGYLVLESKNKEEDEARAIARIQDQALFKVRPMFASIPGVSAPPPFGGNARTIVIRTDPDRLRNYNLSPDDMVKALTAGNVISPSGNVRIQEQMPLVPANAMVVQPKELGNIPIRPGENVFVRDVVISGPNGIDDATDIPSGYALVNGRKAVYILVTKRADASTLAVVNAVRENLPRMQAVLPDDISVRFEFDQSPYVTRSMRGLGIEAALGMLLTGLMVLLFLRDWRSVIVVVLNIPLALLGAVIALYLSGQTINLMTLGGLALAVGILVDEATVEVENINRQMESTPSVALAVRRGNMETAVPRLLAMLCILAVFIPSFFMQGSARALFVPLSLAVGFAMVTSYLLSSTLVPVLSVWLLRSHTPSHREPASARLARLAGFSGEPKATTPRAVAFGSPLNIYAQALQFLVARRWLVAPLYLVGAVGVIGLSLLLLGAEIFPNVDTGQFQMRLRAPAGTRIEQTEAVVKEALSFIQKEIGEDKVEITLGYVGVVASSYPINTVYLWTGGPEEAVVRVALKRGSGIRVEELKTRLRERLSAHLQDWLLRKWLAEGVPSERAERRVRDLRLSFEPADIVNEVMSFGSPTPVEVVVSGPKLADNQAFAEKVQARLEDIRPLRDLQFVQSLDYPTVDVQIDREKAGLSGVTVEEVTKALLAATSSSRFVVPNYWRDPGTGIGYQVQVEVPQVIMNSVQEVEMIPVKRGADGSLLLLRDVAVVRRSGAPGELDRYNMRRYLSMTANIEGEDLYTVSRRIKRALNEAGEVPAGIAVDVRGQITPLEELFSGLGVGLILAVVVIFALLWAYFQSFRLALAAVSTVPAVLGGIAVMLLVTGTTLNLQSFMGSIMAVGVAVANAILLVTFADRARRAGTEVRAAAVEGARSRVRPILMTSCAMIAGMIPLALGIGEGGEQTAPLGRAVIGGLLAATGATLFILPGVFALLEGLWLRGSRSLDPFDPEGSHFVVEGVG
jgi:multidrug efflux pump subunit AcrB